MKRLFIGMISIGWRMRVYNLAGSGQRGFFLAKRKFVFERNLKAIKKQKVNPQWRFQETLA